MGIATLIVFLTIRPLTIEVKTIKSVKRNDRQIRRNCDHSLMVEFHATCTIYFWGFEANSRLESIDIFNLITKPRWTIRFNETR